MTCGSLGGSSVPELIDGHREHDDRTDHNLLDGVRPAHLEAPAAQQRHDEGPDQGAENGAFPAGEASTADHGGGDDVQLLADRHGGVADRELPEDQHPGDSGESAAETVQADLADCHRDSAQAGGGFVRTDGEGVPPEDGVVQDKADQEREAEHQPDGGRKFPGSAAALEGHQPRERAFGGVHGLLARGDLGLEVWADKLPLLPGFEKYVEAGNVTKGGRMNRESTADRVVLKEGLPKHLIEAVFDPQTSGGLLFSVDEGLLDADALPDWAVVIGRTLSGEPRMTVRYT